jgi:hypothetical protein
MVDDPFCHAVPFQAQLRFLFSEAVCHTHSALGAHHSLITSSLLSSLIHSLDNVECAKVRTPNAEVEEAHPQLISTHCFPGWQKVFLSFLGSDSLHRDTALVWGQGSQSWDPTSTTFKGDSLGHINELQHISFFCSMREAEPTFQGYYEDSTRIHAAL